MNTSRRIVVTGASSGIGRATVVALAEAGHRVVAVARREDRLASLAAQTGCEIAVVDLRDREAVDAMAATVIAAGPVDAIVNNAGGARGADRVENGTPKDWEWMFQANVMATLNVVQAFLPALRDGGGDIVVLTSTAAHDTYPGGAGYVAAKHAERIIANTLRLELVGEPIRVIEIAPGMVQTEEFSLNRLGSAKAAAAVYAGVAEPLVADDIAEAILWTLARPSHVNIDSMIIRPRAQASNTMIART